MILIFLYSQVIQTQLNKKRYIFNELSAYCLILKITQCIMEFVPALRAKSAKKIILRTETNNFD